MKTAWVISQNSALINSVRTTLRSQLRESCERVSPRKLLAKPFLEDLQWVFLDVSCDTIWEQIAALRQRLDDSGYATVPLIGISDGNLQWSETNNTLLLLDEVLSTSSDETTVSLDETAVELFQERIERATQKREHRWDADFVPIALNGHKLQSHTPSVAKLYGRMHLAARLKESVLLVGETGTGKTTLGGLIHAWSPRRDQPFVSLSCGGFSEGLVGDELFGHVSGAYTGAEGPRTGKFELADGGTILLDEIDTLTLPQQAKLLRVLDTGEFEPLGSNQTRTVDVRVLVGSNRPLEPLVREKTFRADLYYRLCQFKFEIPPLRERPADIWPLVCDFAAECCREYGLTKRSIPVDVLEICQNCSWPGNIRQLRNEVRHAVVYDPDGEALSPEGFSPEVQRDALERRHGQQHRRTQLERKMAQTERQTIQRMLQVNNYNRSATARKLGISRVALYNKMQRLGIPLEPDDEPTDPPRDG